MRSAAIDGFELAYDRVGDGPAVLLLHGWPGDRSDYRAVVPLLAGHADVLVPDLRGFGASDKHDVDPVGTYDAAGQARSVAGLLDELGLTDVVVAGYDVGSRVAQRLAMTRPDLVRALVVTPPAPGVGDRVLAPDPMREFWYQSFHQLGLVEELIDGKPAAVRAYLAHFWAHWSGPDHVVDDAALDAVAAGYSAPGAFRASIGWYRGGAGMVASSLAEQTPAPADRIAAPTTMLWPEHDPLFPRAWSDRLDEFFADVTLQPVNGVGHFAPVEYPQTMAQAVVARLGG